MSQDERQPYHDNLLDGELIPMGRGLRSAVVRNPQDPGYCYKVPVESGEGGWNMLHYEEEVHDVLIALDIPTIPEYTVVEDTVLVDGSPIARYWARMTDLSDGGHNLVFSAPDATCLDIESSERLFASSTGWEVSNPVGFFDELKLILKRGAEAHGEINGVRVNGIMVSMSAGFMLVAVPQGNNAEIKTVVGDYEDGVELAADEKGIFGFSANQWQYYESVAEYLAYVIRFFPQLEDQAREFMVEATGGQYPVERLGQIGGLDSVRTTEPNS